MAFNKALVSEAEELGYNGRMSPQKFDAIKMLSQEIPFSIFIDLASKIH